MNKIIEFDNYERKDLFNHYNDNDNPFLYLTTKIDITNIYNYCKKHKNHYATIGYIIGKTANQIDNFKYRYIDNKIIYYDKLNINYTQEKNNIIGYFTTPYANSYKEYIKNYINIQKDFYNDKYKLESRQDEIWVSCFPWGNFTGLITPYNKKILIPQFIWDKYIIEDNKIYINLMIMIHHGLADGKHIGKFIENLTKNIEQFNPNN